MTKLNPEIGASTIDYSDDHHPERPLKINFYRPFHYQPSDPVIFVQHGMLRNGDDYRDFWIPAAEKYNLLIVAPTFPDAQYPEPENYNNGMVIMTDGGVREYDKWIYNIPARIFEILKSSGITTADKAYLFGHSAGGQFNHRLLATQDNTAFSDIIAANSGWYTLPDMARAFPEGLGGIGLEVAKLHNWLASPMHIFAGDQDIAQNEPSLPSQPEALAQGPHRFARAKFFYKFAKDAAEQAGVPFNWKLIVVSGVPHDGAAMSRAAAAYWFENRIPPADELVLDTTAQL